MWCNYGNWDEIAKKDISDVKTNICGQGTNAESGFKSNFISNNMDNKLKAIITKDASVIDFGCGLGRNSSLLKKYFINIYGCDIPEMVNTFYSLQDKTDFNRYIAISSNLDKLLENNIEYIFESVVFQHIICKKECSKIAENIGNSNIKILIGLYNSACTRLPLVYTLLIKDYNFKISYEEIESESFGLPHTFLILEKQL